MICTSRMTGIALAAFCAGLVSAQSAATHPAANAAAATPTTPRAFLNHYCVVCHNQRLKTAGLMLDKLDPSNPGPDAKIWEEAVLKLQGHLMPPPGMPQPKAADRQAVIAALEHSLDAAVAKNPNPGHVALHRLNRTEYSNDIQSILGVHVDVDGILPPDDTADGFDNVANVLKVSPSFLEQYIAAARLATSKAIGNPIAAPITTPLRPTGGSNNEMHVEGLPLGTRGGFVDAMNFPADGTYEFTVSGLAGAFYMHGLEYPNRVLLTIDGKKVFESHVGGEADLRSVDQKQAPAVAAINKRFEKIPVQVKSGVHKVGVTFVSLGMDESDETLQPFVPGSLVDRLPRARGIDVRGPLDATGVSGDAARKKIFVCNPANEGQELSCAHEILAKVAREAYRRPVTDRDLSAPMAFFKEGRAETGRFDGGIQNALTAILASPKFLYRAEPPPPGQKPGTAYRLTDLELASRLSYFLWSQHPDDALIDLAVANKLHEPTILEQQVHRMLEDPKAQSLSTNFAYQWLGMKGIKEMKPDPALFPDFDGRLRAAFLKELEMFFQSVVTEDRDVVDLLTANYTFVNERLARNYGIPGITGDQFRRVTLADPNRWGLLGKGGILMSTSYGNRTTPVLRGKFILEDIMGTPPSPPPNNVGALPDPKPGFKAHTVRELMEEHRKNPSCNACHGIMDPLGFAMDNFNAIGEWRTVDRFAGTPIDASGKLADGTPVSGVSDLRRALASNPRQFVQTMTRKMMIFALGRQLEYYDMPVVRKIVSETAADHYRFSSLVMGIVNSAPFQMRELPAETEIEAKAPPAPSGPAKTGN